MHRVANFALEPLRIDTEQAVESHGKFRFHY
jgi:hypothetical protein